MPGADLEALKKDVFGQFVNVANESVETVGPDALTQELREFVHCVKTGQAPHVDGVQALEAMIVANEVLQEIATHRWDGHPHGNVGPYPRTPFLPKKAG